MRPRVKCPDLPQAENRAKWEVHLGKSRLGLSDVKGDGKLEVP